MAEAKPRLGADWVPILVQNRVRNAPQLRAEVCATSPPPTRATATEERVRRVAEKTLFPRNGLTGDFDWQADDPADGLANAASGNCNVHRGPANCTFPV